jgi:hypothetical protein
VNALPGQGFERVPGEEPVDETEVSLRAYLSRLADEHLSAYDPSWTDARVIEWDGNFRSDGCLMLVCCERDIDVDDFRRALAEHLRHRKLKPRA